MSKQQTLQFLPGTLVRLNANYLSVESDTVINKGLINHIFRVAANRGNNKPPLGASLGRLFQYQLESTTDPDIKFSNYSKVSQLWFTYEWLVPISPLEVLAMEA